jgi:magnesium chelatase family protein
MHTARVTTVAPEGLSGRLVTVEVAARPGISSLKIVGLAGRTVAEAKERVRVALRGCGVKLPATNIVVNLAPAEVSKTGTHYDLPIALGLLIATKVIPANCLDGVVVAAELALNGDLCPVRHGAIIAFTAEQKNLKLLTAAGNLPSVSLARQLRVATSPNLGKLIDELKDNSLNFRRPPSTTTTNKPAETNFEDIVGLTQPKRALLLAAAGHHHLLLCGSPGVGKSLLANTIVSLLPPLSDQQRRTLTALHGQPITSPPWRAPHHSATTTAIIGGGTELHPGEISLAHGGVLFLDELPRFNPTTLQALLEPIESARVQLSRDGRSVDYPAGALVVGAYNPCPCGYYGDAKICCRCSSNVLNRYQARLSGPLMSRFSLFAPCHSSQTKCELTTAAARELVSLANAQIVRRSQAVPNGRAATKLVRQWLEPPKLADQATRLLRSGRSWRAVINAGCLARTIADIDGCLDINADHFTEAIGWLPPIQDIV